MDVKCIVLGELLNNCYIVTDNGEQMIIDPACCPEKILPHVSNLKYIVLTHAHFDHMGAVEALREATGAPLLVGEFDSAAISDPKLNLSSNQKTKISLKPAERLLTNGEIIVLGDSEFKVVHSPGHTRGSICLVSDKTLFSGDTLFKGTVGRFEFEDRYDMELSCKRLLIMDPDIVVYPGHFESSTIDEIFRSLIGFW